MTSETREPPACAGCAGKVAAVLMRDGRALCGGCAIVAVMPLIEATPPRRRPTIRDVMAV